MQYLYLYIGIKNNQKIEMNDFDFCLLYKNITKKFLKNQFLEERFFSFKNKENDKIILEDNFIYFYKINIKNINLRKLKKFLSKTFKTKIIIKKFNLKD